MMGRALTDLSHIPEAVSQLEHAEPTARATEGRSVRETEPADQFVSDIHCEVDRTGHDAPWRATSQRGHSLH